MNNKSNKNLIIELNRIHEIMGVNSFIIKEGLIPVTTLNLFTKLAKEFGDDFFKTLKKGVVEVDEIINKTASKVINLTADDMAILLKHLTTEGTSVLAKKMYQIDSVFSISQRSQVLNHLVDEVVKNTANYEKVTKKLLDAEKSFFNLFNKENPMPDYLSRLSREYQKLFRNELDTIIKTKYPEVWDTIIKGSKGLRANETKILASLTRGTKEFISEIANGTSLQEIQSWIRINLRMFTDARTLQDEFNRLAVDAEEKISKAVMPDYELKKMADVLAATKKKFDSAPKYMYENWVTNNKDFPERIKRELDQIPNRFNDLYQEMIKKSTIWEVLSTESAAFKSMFKIFASPFKKTGRLLIFRTGPEAAEAWKRLGMYIAVMDPRFPKEWLRALMIRGVKRDLALTITLRFIEHAFIWPAFASFLKTTAAAGVSIAEYLVNQLPWIKNVDFIEYNESKENRYFSLWWDEVKRDFNLRIPQNVSEYIDSATQLTASDDAINLGLKIYDKFAKYLFKGSGKDRLIEFDDSDIDESLEMENQEFQDWLRSQPDSVRTWWEQERQRLRVPRTTNGSESQTSVDMTNQTGPRSNQPIEVNPDELPD